METKPEDSAYPWMDTSPMTDRLTISEYGLSKREWFAAMALQGILANSHENWVQCDRQTVVNEAIFAADALIERLNYSDEQ